MWIKGKFSREHHMVKQIAQAKKVYSSVSSDVIRMKSYFGTLYILLINRSGFGVQCMIPVYINCAVVPVFSEPGHPIFKQPI